MEKEKLTLTREQAKDLVYDDLEGFTTVSNKIISNGRWTLRKEIIVKRESDGKYFKDTYSEGATEQQDESPYEYRDPNFTEVFAVQKTITVYE